jgi:hypothetical protein
MKTTIELPDQLMTEVKVLAAIERRKLGELMAELVRNGLAHHKTRPAEDENRQRAAQQWLDEWVQLGAATLRDAPPVPTATQILASDRNRLERR